MASADGRKDAVASCSRWNRQPSSSNGLVRPRRRIDDFPFDVGKDLAALFIEAVSDDAGRSCETRLLQIGIQ